MLLPQCVKFPLHSLTKSSGLIDIKMASSIHISVQLQIFNTAFQDKSIVTTTVVCYLSQHNLFKSFLNYLFTNTSKTFFDSPKQYFCCLSIFRFMFHKNPVTDVNFWQIINLQTSQKYDMLQFVTSTWFIVCLLYTSRCV